MYKSNIHPLPLFFDKYINLVEQEDLFKSFEASMQSLASIDLELYRKVGNLKYRPDKWSTKDVLQHIIDTERIMSYRALRFARMDSTALQGFDEKLFGRNSGATHRIIDELVEELKIVRISTIHLFKSFAEKDLKNCGICFNQNISVLALGFVIVGHQIHHLNIIGERYLPLADK